MTIRELQNHVYNIRISGYGHFNFTFEYKRKKYECTTNDTISVDRIKEGDEWGNKGLKQAYESLYYEGLRMVRKCYNFK